MKKIFYYTKFSDNIKNEAEEKRMSISAVAAIKLLDNLYTFDDTEIRLDKVPKKRNGTKQSTISLTDKEYEEVEKIAKHYGTSVAKLSAFIINQYFEGINK